MKRASTFEVATVMASLALLGLSVGCGNDDADSAEATSSVADTQPQEMAAAESTPVSAMAFRNAVNCPPSGWTGPVFQLSDKYPASPPGGDLKSKAPWLNQDVDFCAPEPQWDDGWDDYMQDLLNFIRHGQNEQLAECPGWLVQVDGATRWFHVPWMAYNPYSGREFVHGLTNERTTSLSALIGDEQQLVSGANRLPLKDGYTEDEFQTWAFGVYNDYGAYSIGQAFPPSGVPQTVSASPAPRPAGLPFAEGTLVAKLLFTTASDSEVYFLKGSPEWTANGHVGQYPDLDRAPLAVHLVQIDVAVADSRSPTGWVFGTFAYNGTLPGGNVWDRLSPVGLQWGGDPLTFPAVPYHENKPIKESVLAQIDIYEHYGAQGRLAGPVDNPDSSCLSCHQGAFAANPVGTVGDQGTNIPQIFSFTGMGTEYNEQNEYYFSNMRFPGPYPQPKGAEPSYVDAIPLDTSLQFQVAFNSYATFTTSGGQ